MRSPLTTGIVAISVTFGLWLGCAVDVDVANKACPCGSGFVCDTARDVCVSPGQLVVTPDASAPDTGGPPACAGDACPCAVDGDCKERERPKCGAAKKCVECTLLPTDSCPVGSFCNASSQCTLGCKQESDCQISPTVPHCQLTRHKCVECTSTAQCMGGKSCSPSGTCVQGCTVGGAPCAVGTCCAGFCLDTTADELNCGGCGTACSTTNGTAKCAASVCTWACALGFTHCDSGNTGCETNTASDMAHCGSCAKRCDNFNANGVACTGGVCGYTTCLATYDNCDGNRTNGCECRCGQQQNDPCCPGDVCAGGLSCTGGGGNKKCH